MNNTHEIILPVKIVVGSSILDKTHTYLSEALADTGKVGLITGINTYKIAGRIVEESLVKSGYETYTWFVEDASVSEAERIIRDVNVNKLRIFVGIGGGKAIDIAKYVAMKLQGIVISIPTAPSHDGLASPFASLKGLDKPLSIRAKTPYAILADIEVISKAPPRLIRSGVGDLLGKLVAVKDWRLAHKLRNEYYGEYAAHLALLSAKHVIRYHELVASMKPEGVRVLVEALISSGVAMCIAGSSRPASGSEHLFSHALEQLAPGRALHGERVAFGTILMLYLYGDKRWILVKKIMKKLGLPTTVKELGVDPETVVEALVLAPKIRPDRYTILGENGISRDAAWRLLSETGVI